jgi:hypothetical protein
MTELKEKFDSIIAWKLWEKLFLLFEFLLIPILLLVLFFDFRRRLDAGSREQIGTITFKEKTVQRKFTDRVVWESMENSFPLYNKDSIRTGELSDAEITLTDGTKLAMDENSLIVLNITKGEQEIDFAYGTLSAKNSDNQSGEGIKIKSGETVVSLEKSDVSLTQNTDKSIILDVKTGVANLFQDGKENKVSDGEKAVLSDKPAEIVKKTIKVNFPPSNYKVVNSSSKNDIEFNIEGIDSSVKITLEVYKDKKLTQVFSKRSISGNLVKESFPAGVYYWVIKSNNSIESSGKISSLQVSSATPINPVNKHKYFIGSGVALVSFAWSRQDEISQSFVEVSQDPDFKNIITEKGTYGKSISMELTQGNYYWRVKSIINPNTAALYSITQNFEVTQEEQTQSPILILPKPQDSLPSTIVAVNGINFIWSEIKGYQNYNLEISRRPDFSDSIKINSIDKNSYQYKGDLQPGIHFWRINGVTSSGKNGNFSKNGTFEINAITGNALSLQSVAIISTTKVLQEGLLLKWKKLPIQGTYEVILSKDQDFKNIVKKVVTNLNQTVVKDIGQGQYYWKVNLIDKDGQPALSSDSKEVLVEDSISAKYPKAGQIVNMSQKENLIFEWSPREGAKNFTIQIFHIKGKENILILQKATGTNTFIMDELELLDEGKFQWQVLYENPDTGEKTVEFSSNFIISLDPMPDNLELLTPKVQYAE